MKDTPCRKQILPRNTIIISRVVIQKLGQGININSKTRKFNIELQFSVLA